MPARSSRPRQANYEVGGGVYDARSIGFVGERRRWAGINLAVWSLNPCQFMDGWTFDTQRLSKCSCQHLFADGHRIPSCGYYAYHRKRDPRFSSQ